jgi:hypothetical protein
MNVCTIYTRFVRGLNWQVEGRRGGNSVFITIFFFFSKFYIPRKMFSRTSNVSDPRMETTILTEVHVPEDLSGVLLHKHSEAPWAWGLLSS